MNFSYSKGFTLIELLVVISIIGVLATVVLSSLNEARQRSQEARKLSDLSQLRTAFELYYLDNGEYPDIFSGEAAYCIGKLSSENCWNGMKSGNDVLNNQIGGYLPLDYFANLPSNDGSAFLYHNGRISRRGCYADYAQGTHLVWQPFVDGSLPQSAADCPGESFLTGCGYGMWDSGNSLSRRHCALLLED